MPLRLSQYPTAARLEALAVNAHLAFEQTKSVWDDHVGYAETLREKRKAYSIGLVIAAGLGVFRMQWYRNGSDVRVIADDFVQTALSLGLVIAIICMLLAAYFLYTERPVLSASINKHLPTLAPLSEWCRDKLGLAAFDDQLRDRRAVTALEVEPHVVDLMLRSHTHEVWLYKQTRLQVACERLSAANARVNFRITVGVFAMGVAYAILVMVFVLYAVFAIPSGGVG